MGPGLRGAIFNGSHHNSLLRKIGCELNSWLGKTLGLLTCKIRIFNIFEKHETKNYPGCGRVECKKKCSCDCLHNGPFLWSSADFGWGTLRMHTHRKQLKIKDYMYDCIRMFVRKLPFVRICKSLTTESSKPDDQHTRRFITESKNPIIHKVWFSCWK